MSRVRVLLVALILLVILVQPVLAQGNEGGRVLFGSDYNLPDGQAVDGDVVVFGGNVTLAEGSSVRGSVMAIGGSVYAAGRVSGGVFALGGEVELRSGAVVMGDVLTSGQVSQDAGARVSGRVVNGFAGLLPFDGIDGWRGDYPRLGCGPAWRTGPQVFGDALWWLLRSVMSAVALLVLGVLIVLVAPGATRNVADTALAFPLPGLGVGLLTALVAVLAIPILVITCLGIPLAVLAAAALAVAVTFGWVAAAVALGGRVLAAAHQQGRAPVVAAIVGLLLLAVLANLPCLGWLVTLLVGAWGLGTVVLTRFGSTPYAGTPPRVV
jgi:hypothetical protein